MLSSNLFRLCAGRVPRQDIHAWYRSWGGARRHSAGRSHHWVETWLAVDFCAEYGTANLSLKSASVHLDFKWAYHFRMQRPRPRRKHRKCLYPPIYHHERRPEHLYAVDHFVRARGGRWVWWRDGYKRWRDAHASDPIWNLPGWTFASWDEIGHEYNKNRHWSNHDHDDHNNNYANAQWCPDFLDTID